MQLFLSLIVAAVCLGGLREELEPISPARPTAPAIPVERGNFRNAEKVKVSSLPKGHGGTPLAIEEPFVARDGKFLFFNSNQQEGEKDLHYKRVMRNINSNELDYAAGISKDGLEIFFTRFEVSNYANRKLESRIMRATRSAVNQPFGKPEVVEAIGARHFVEGPALSADEKELFYHRHVNGKSRLFRVTRQ